MDNNPFWNYTLHVYEIETVRNILLRWQDDYGCDVNVLLCCCWLASRQQQLTEAQLLELQRVCELWRSQCLLPLRNIRRYVKQQPAADSIYQQLKSAEISAEQWQQDLMFQCQQSFSWEDVENSQGPGALNLRRYFGLLNTAKWDEVVADAEELLSLLKL